MLAAEENPFLLESVAHDADAASLAFWRQRMDRAFEAVEGMGGTVHAHLERLVVVVSASHLAMRTSHLLLGLEGITRPIAGSSGPNGMGRPPKYLEFRREFGRENALPA